MMFLHQKPDSRVKRLEKQVLDLAAKLDAKDRIIQTMQAEIDSMAGVIARDRQRVAAECAAYARQRAEHEGTSERTTESNPRLRALVQGG